MRRYYDTENGRAETGGPTAGGLDKKKYTPMTTVIVTGAFVELLSTELGAKPDDD